MNQSKFIPSKLLARRDSIIRALKYTVSDCQRTLSKDTDGEFDGEIDVRLCVDGDGSTYIIRTGLVDYDPYHSRFCAADFITMDTDAETLADTLIESVLDSAAENMDGDE